MYILPIPSWLEAKEIFGRAWDFHVYGVGMASVVLVVLAVYSIIVISKLPKLGSRGYFLALNCLVLIFGLVRSTYMLVDGYNSLKIFPLPVDLLLMEIGFPCLTSSFYVLFAALFKVTIPLRKMQSNIFSVRWLVIIITTIMLSSIAVDIVVGVYMRTTVLLLVSEIVFILVNLAFCAGFFFIFGRLYLSATWRPTAELSTSDKGSSAATTKMTSISAAVDASHYVAKMTSAMLPFYHQGRSSTKTATCDESQPPGRHDSTRQGRSSRRRRLGSTIVVSAIAASFFFLNAVAHIVDIGWKLHYTGAKRPAPWLWWTHALVLRIIELCMAYTMLYVASGPCRKRRCRHSRGDRLMYEWELRRGVFRSGRTVEVVERADMCRAQVYRTNECP